MSSLKTICIAMFAMLVSTSIFAAVCNGYNTGGVVNCYTSAVQVPTQGKVVPSMSAADLAVKSAMVDMGIGNVSISVRYSDTLQDKRSGVSRLVYNMAFGHSISNWSSRGSYNFFTQSEDAVSNYDSMTKDITEALLKDFIQKGYVSVSDNVFCLPGNTAAKCWITGYTATESRYARVTIQNVLDFKIGQAGNSLSEGVSKSAIQAVLNIPMVSDPNTIAEYNQFGHQMLGVLLEIVAQQYTGQQRSFEELVHVYLSRPIGIRDVDFFQIKDNRPEFRDPRTMWYNSNSFGLNRYGDGKVGGSSDYWLKAENLTSAAGWAGTAAAYAKFAHVYGCKDNGALDGSSSSCFAGQTATVVVLANKMFVDANAADYRSPALEVMNKFVLFVSAGLMNTSSQNLEIVDPQPVLAMEYKLIRPENGREAYFRTGSQAEIDGLAAALANDPNYLLKPTTNSFHAWPKGYTGHDVRRFIFDIKNQSGASIGASHWYGIDYPSADGVNYTSFFHGLNPFRKPDQGLMFEAATFSAFPLNSDGTCPTPASDITGKVPPGLVPLYSIYNNAFALSQAGTIAFNDGNHRFTTQQSVVDEMLAKGWKLDGKVYCVLP